MAITIGIRARRRLTHTAVHALLLVGGLVMIFPLLWMVNTSLKALPEIFTYPPTWIPAQPQWRNYVEALTYQPFDVFFRNTVLVVAFTVAGDLLSASFVGYGFARFRFPGRDTLFILLVSTMMVPFIVRLVPLFLLYKQLGWINTFLPLIVPSWLGTPFFVFLMRQFYLTIPSELVDAARVDGCSEVGIWARIMTPLCGPALTVVAILSFQHAWNDFLAPLIFLNDTSMKTFALGMLALLHPVGAATELWHWLMAVTTTMIAPVVILFLLLQRYFVQGVTLTGIKG